MTRAVSEGYDDLARKLDRLEIVNCDKKPFIPDDRFDGALTYEFLSTCVSDLLPSEDAGAHRHIPTLYKSYRKVIAILVMMRYEKHFVNFWEKNTNDRDLPLDQERLRSIDEELWWPKFNTLQYKFLARVYCEETESQQWTDDYVLPILDKVYRNRGAFSEVYKIRIHPYYDRLNFRGDQEQHWYALKQLKTSADAKVNERKLREWHDEVAANALVRKQQHNNYAYNSILPLLHSHTYGKQCNLIFPLANYNLKEFYAKEQKPPNGGHRFKFIEQISRLVPALGLIHQGEIDSTCQWIGLHRDLKPDNILVVCGATPRFMISDLGLMKFRKVKSGEREYSGEEWQLGVSAYKAPECDVKGKRVGRGADIWSLGCILAEAITWCVYGQQGIRDFQDKRSTPDIYGDSSDVFFCKSSSPPQTVDPGAAAKEVPRLKTEVLEWFCEVKKAAGDDPLIVDSLGLVELMLKENDRGAKGRPSAEKIDCAFYKILKREAEKEFWPLSVQEPSYYSKNQGRRLNAFPRDVLPFSYSRSTSLMSPTTPGPIPFGPGFPTLGSVLAPGVPKRRRSEDESFVPPSLPNADSGSTLRPFKRKREVSAFAHLKRLDTMFLIDDNVSETPWNKIRTTLQKLSDIATKWDQDGVDLAFINSSAYFSCLSTTADALAALDKVGPSRSSSATLSHRLDVLLSKYVALYTRDEFTKPLNLIIITSGDFVPYDEFEVRVMKWAKELDTMYAPKSQLGLQFVLVGCKGENRKRFEDLDDEMYKVYGVRDMVDATCYDPDEPDNQEVFEKIMCGGMIKMFDRVQVETSDLSMMSVDG